MCQYGVYDLPQIWVLVECIINHRLGHQKMSAYLPQIRVHIYYRYGCMMSAYLLLIYSEYLPCTDLRVGVSDSVHLPQNIGCHYENIFTTY